VPLAAGGTGDTLARLLAEEMAKSLGGTLIIDNRPGSGGIIGTEAVAKGAPDGYTLLHTSSSHVMHPALRPKLSYDAVKDFAVIARTADTHQVLLAHPSFPPNSAKELLAYARANRVFYGSAGNGSATHLHMELLKSLAGIELEHVPYKGSTQARTDLLAGQIQLAFDGLLPNLPQLRAGKLKALALASSRRSAAAPEVPTLSEAGVPAYQSDTWYALFAPAGVAKPVLERLRSTAEQALKAPALREKFLQQGAEPTDSTPAELESLMRAELARWTKLVAEAHVKID
jgi:tripartite-type tricarboxylate transporter receptor subunit TctC